MSKTILVVIPAYNEEKSIPTIYSELMSLSRKIKKYKLKNVFVNDCSSDDTLTVLKKIKLKNKEVSIVNLKKRSGAWVGLKVVINNFESDYLTLLTADLQIPRSIIKDFIRNVEGKKVADTIFAEGHPHGSGFFSIIYWAWIFFRYKGRLMSPLIDTFFINKKTITLIRESKGYPNIIPLQIFKSKNYSLIKFKKRPRKFGRSKYSLFSCVVMFIKTFLLSLNLDFLVQKNIKYEIIY